MKFTKRFKILTISLVLILGGLSIAMVQIDQWLFVMLDPGAFDASKTPPQPNYQEEAAWAALPAMVDGADVFIPEFPAIDQAQAPVDLFYVHPTTWVGGEWNGPTQDSMVIEATHRGGTLIQASAFNAICAIYAPRYRQANGKAFTQPNEAGSKALDIAYGDVAAAFDLFIDRYNQGRPFLLAGHSQGTALASRLFKEKIWDTPLYDRFVVAYLIGGPITRETIGVEVPICHSENQTGCIVAWNARGPKYAVNDLEFASLEQPEATKTLAGRIVVNPLSWTTDTAYVPNSLHKGALFLDADQPAILPTFADAQCMDGALIVRNMGTPYRDTPSRILDWIMGPENYHPFEYQLFYLNIRENAVKRVEAFLDTEPELTETE